MIVLNKPIKPNKPIEPAEHILKTISVLILSDMESFTIENLRSRISGQTDQDPETIKFYYSKPEFKGFRSEDYRCRDPDEDLELFADIYVKNESYNSQMFYYKTQLDRYEDDMISYNLRMKEYSYLLSLKEKDPDAYIIAQKEKAIKKIEDEINFIKNKASWAR